MTEVPSATPHPLSAAFEQASRLQQAGRHTEAEQLYRQILASKPEVASAWQNLGLLLAGMGQRQQGIDCLSRALALQPDLPFLRIQQGILLHQAGQPTDALALLQRHTTHQPKDQTGWYNLAVVAQTLEQFDQALAAYQRALTLEPTHPETLYNLAQLERRLGQIDAAIEHFQRLIAHVPNHANGHFQLAGCYRQANDIDGAIRHYRLTIAAQPDSGAAWSNLGNLLKDCGQHDEARHCLTAALRIQPDLPEAKFNLAILDLITGQLAVGWPGLARRWSSPSFPSPARYFPCPPWRGEDLRQRSLLLWGEQGVGDEIILAQMIDEIASQTSDCLVECDPRLAPLFARSFPQVTILPRGQPDALPILPRPVDYHSSLVDFGGHLRRGFEQFPRHTGYLRPPGRLRHRLHHRYRQNNDDRLVIGLSWSSRNPSFGRQKSVALADLAPILTARPARFVSLQYGADPIEVAATARQLSVDLFLDAEIDPLIDLDGFAAQIAAMDLIITTSSTTAHMAGALGKPCWVLVPTGTGLLWYWFLDRTDSPWYPSVTLFRQPHDGNWIVPIQAIADRLTDYIITSFD